MSNRLCGLFAESTMADQPTNPTLESILHAAFAGRNIILHGPGGVGKSYIMREIATRLINEFGLKVFMTATTGVAAVNLSSGSLQVTTLHRFAGVGTAQLSAKALISKVKDDFRAKLRWKKCQVLFIDEISMLGGNLFEKLDAIAKAIREDSRPFGGIRLVVGGDFLQLPPVKDTWIFHTDAWKALNIRPFILEVPHRYDDVEFFQILLRVRMGELTDDDYKALRSRVRAHLKMQQILADLTNENPAEVIRPTVFFSRRADVESYNLEELGKLPGEEFEFVAKDEFVKLKGNPLPEDYSKLLDDDMPRSVTLKVGAQVMLKVNFDVNEGLVNGSRGVVSEIVPGEAVIVKFLNGKKIRIDLHTRDLTDKYAMAKRTQIPVVLAYAMTIHKSQGSTLDYAVIDLGPSVFECGQAYVALSRCRNLRGMFISELIPRSIMASKDAVKYADELKKKALTGENI